MEVKPSPTVDELGSKEEVIRRCVDISVKTNALNAYYTILYYTIFYYTMLYYTIYTILCYLSR